MRVPPNRFSRIVAFVVPTAVVMTLAACGTPTEPGQTPRARRGDSPTAALRATQLTDSTNQITDDSTGRGPVQPWY